MSRLLLNFFSRRAEIISFLWNSKVSRLITNQLFQLIHAIKKLWYLGQSTWLKIALRLWKLSVTFLAKLYRPRQPNWKYTMWKFQDFSDTQIIREINFGHFKGPKIAILTISALLNFTSLGTHEILMCEIFQKIKIQGL